MYIKLLLRPVIKQPPPPPPPSSIPLPQRGLIYTVSKPIGRHCRRCNPFFYEFQVAPAVNKYKFVSCIATPYMHTTDTKGERVDLNRRLAQLYKRRRGLGGHVLSCDASSQGCAVGCTGWVFKQRAAELQATVNLPAYRTYKRSSTVIFTTHGMHGLQGQYSRVAYSGVHR